MKQPHYSLERVRELTREGKIWLSKGKAMNSFDTPKAAYEFAARVAELLSVEHFSETVTLVWEVADVYGIRIDDAGWYVKLYIDETEPEASFISLHPLARTLKTNSGKVNP